MMIQCRIEPPLVGVSFSVLVGFFSLFLFPIPIREFTFSEIHYAYQANCQPASHFEENLSSAVWRGAVHSTFVCLCKYVCWFMHT